MPDRSPRERRTDRLPVRMFSIVVALLIIMLAGSIYVGVEVLVTLNAAHSHSLGTFHDILHNQLVICERTPNCPVGLLEGVHP